MRKIISAASAAAVLGVISLAGIAPAAADSIRGAQDRMIAEYCNGQMDPEICNDWRYNRDRWSPEEYRGFYEKHRNEVGLNNADAAAAFAQPGTYASGQPAYLQPGSGQPVYLQPGSTQPVYLQQGSAQPVYVQPGSQPVYVQQGTNEPIYLQPGSNQPGYVVLQSATQDYPQVNGQPVYVVVPNQPIAGRADSRPIEVGVQRGNVEGNQPEVIGDSPTHVADCIATFKSYNVSTDSYYALDGSVHRCKL